MTREINAWMTLVRRVIVVPALRQTLAVFCIEEHVCIYGSVEHKAAVY